MKSVAIIGCGAICSELVRGFSEGIIGCKLIGLYDIYPEKCRDLVKKYGLGDVVVASSIKELLDLGPDIIVEAASPDAVKEYALEIVSRGIDLVVLSVGALLDKDFMERLRDALEKSGSRIIIPSGAIAGLDAIKALRLVGIDRVVLRTRKPPSSLKSKANIDLEGISEPTVVFSGDSYRAVREFPVNINVSATLTIASGSPVHVEIIADPMVDKNIHEIEVYSRASHIRITVENMPSPSNPRTSYLAALSALNTLKTLCSMDKIVII